MRREFLYLENNNLIKVLGLKNTDSGLAEEDAVVHANIYSISSSEALVGGQAWPLILVHTQNGDYEGTLSDTIELDPRHKYRLKVRAETPDGNVATWDREIRGIRRRV